ncbi:Serine dehydrogenase proteinase [compost metagenome]
MAIVDEIAKLSARTKKDCYVYVGGISRNGYREISDHFRKKTFPEAYLFLATYGGDPDAGFRIARGLRHHYEKLTIIVPSYCKSAGTLLAIGADELVISDLGELGPLDMQLKKPDELFDMSSGLDITQAMAFLRTQSTDILKSTLVDLKVDLEVTTKLSAEIATKMAHGLVSPIYAQIDPYKIGESQRAISIAFAYGKRLNDKIKNLKSDDSLRSLVLDYPSHGFVIDRKEASNVFKNVRAPSEMEQVVVDEIYDVCKNPTGGPMVFLIPPSSDDDNLEGNENAENGTDRESAQDSSPERSGELAAEPDARSNQGSDQGSQPVSDPESE